MSALCIQRRVRKLRLLTTSVVGSGGLSSPKRAASQGFSSAEGHGFCGAAATNGVVLPLDAALGRLVGACFGCGVSVCAIVAGTVCSASRDGSVISRSESLERDSRSDNKDEFERIPRMNEDLEFDIALDDEDEDEAFSIEEDDSEEGDSVPLFNQ